MTYEFIARVRALQAAVALTKPREPGEWSGNRLDLILAVAATFQQYLLSGEADTLTPLRTAAQAALDQLDQP